MDNAKKRVFCFNPETGEYTSFEPARLDPVASQRKGSAVYLLPPNATLTPPCPEKPGYARIWDGQAWEYAEDRRGMTIWKDYDTCKLVTEPGAIPEGWSLERPAPPREVRLEMYRGLVRQTLTLEARKRGYDSIASILSYWHSTNSTWRSEARAFNAWRDAVFATALPFLNDYAAGNAEPLTDDAFIAMLPRMQWPDSYNAQYSNIGE